MRESFMGYCLYVVTPVRVCDPFPELSGCWWDSPDGLQLKWETGYGSIDVTVQGMPPRLAGVVVVHSDVMTSDYPGWAQMPLLMERVDCE